MCTRWGADSTCHETDEQSRQQQDFSDSQPCCCGRYTWLSQKSQFLFPTESFIQLLTYPSRRFPDCFDSTNRLLETTFYFVIVAKCCQNLKSEWHTSPKLSILSIFSRTHQTVVGLFSIQLTGCLQPLFTFYVSVANVKFEWHRLINFFITDITTLD